MEIAYRLQAELIQEKLKKYHTDLVQICQYSKHIEDEIVKYVVSTLHDDSNPEIARIVVEVSFRYIISMDELLKLLVKMLYVVRNITRYRYSDYYALKDYVDKTLDKIGSNKSQLAKQKYPALLAALENETKEPNETPTHIEAMENLRDNVNRGYIKFI